MNRLTSIIGCTLLIAGCCTSQESDVFYTLENGAGMQVKITNYGGRIASILVPDKNGEMRDVVLGFDTVDEYRPENNQSDFGAAIGRYANRINQGRFTLDGVEYDLPKNNYGHCLHGGPEGWQYKSYTAVSSDKTSLKLRIDSPDGDMNFPGDVTAYVTYNLTEDNRIEISYEATTTKPTIINMTNHSYFNLSGDPANHSIESDLLYINASNYTPVDNTFMTSGEIADVTGTPFDFRVAHPISEGLAEQVRNEQVRNEQLQNGNGFDHNWVLDTEGDIEIPAAKLTCPESGIVLTVYTDEPGIQIYSGNFLDGTVKGKGGVTYNFRHAICLETQHYPDSPNKADWPSVVLRPGETYRSHCTFAFSVAE